jgi:glycosyltransferase involved in cell wall biosynthesis
MGRNDVGGLGRETARGLDGMTRRPKVSIIVNNYNYGRFLWEAIDSALTQSYSHREVIVVDDGSTDNSREVIAGYGELVIPVLKENGGQASAFNAGFAASTGELVLFLDSDDMLEPYAIETVVWEWRDGISRMLFPLLVIDEKSMPRGNVHGGDVGLSPIWGPFGGGGSPTSGNAFSRAALEKIMPIPEDGWKVCADNYVCSAALLFGRALRITMPLGKYRVHGRNNFCFETEQPLAQLRGGIDRSLRLHAALSRLTDGKIRPLDEWLGASPEHWVRRLTSLRESPADHPWPDTRVALSARLVRSIWRYPLWNVRHRLGNTLFAIIYCALPWRAARTLRNLRDRNRGPTLRRVLGQ